VQNICRTFKIESYITLFTFSIAHHLTLSLNKLAAQYAHRLPGTFTVLSVYQFIIKQYVVQ